MVEAEALGVEAEAVDELAASTSLFRAVVANTGENLILRGGLRPNDEVWVQLFEINFRGLFFRLANICSLMCVYIFYHHQGGHKRTAWGCSRIPKAEKVAIIREKIFNIWAKYTATFTRK